MTIALSAIYPPASISEMSRADLQDTNIRAVRPEGEVGRYHAGGAVAEIERGLISADLGGGVIKQRVARRGGGKSGGFRTIILFRTDVRAVFVYGFEKSARDNIDTVELAAFRMLASRLLATDDEEIETALETGALIEVLE